MSNFSYIGSSHIRTKRKRKRSVCVVAALLSDVHMSDNPSSLCSGRIPKCGQSPMCPEKPRREDSFWGKICMSLNIETHYMGNIFPGISRFILFARSNNWRIFNNKNFVVRIEMKFLNWNFLNTGFNDWTGPKSLGQLQIWPRKWWCIAFRDWPVTL
jgi:hypothetical protein